MIYALSGSHVFPSALALHALGAVYFFWIIAETGIRYLAGRHKAGTLKKGDRGSFRAVIVGYLASVVLALGVRAAGIGLLPAWMEWPGLAIMLLGIALRTWAIFLLGRFFSMRVELQAGHHVVSAGPYRYIRHPAYTGMMITFAGLGLALGSWVAALLMAVIFWAVLGYRVRVEEGFLLSSLGDEYRAYMERTGRFIPRLGGRAGKKQRPS